MIVGLLVHGKIPETLVPLILSSTRRRAVESGLEALARTMINDTFRGSF